MRYKNGTYLIDHKTRPIIFVLVELKMSSDYPAASLWMPLGCVIDDVSAFSLLLRNIWCGPDKRRAAEPGEGAGVRYS